MPLLSKTLSRLCQRAGAEVGRGSGELRVGPAVQKLSRQLADAQVAEPDVSSRHLMAGVLGSRNLESVDKQGERVLTADQANRWQRYAHCRLARMPVQYILGEWDFGSLRAPLKMRPPVFIPRPETEQLVELAAEALLETSGARRVLEVGCGSGAVSLSLLQRARDAAPARGDDDAKVLAVDQSQAACQLTLENALALGLEEGLTVVRAKVEEGAELREVEEGPHFDVIVSNPPYVLRKDMMSLAPEITLYEDLRALDGGQDGLSVVMPILQLASRRLASRGRVFLEMDPCHAYLIPQQLSERPDIRLRVTRTVADFSGKDRFVVLERLEQ